MLFLVNECTGPTVARWLDDHGHDAVPINDENPGLDDASVIARADDENRILVTNDKDFGERVFRRRQTHAGVILLRLDDERMANKIAVLRDLLRSYGKRLPGAFVVATEEDVRFG